VKLGRRAFVCAVTATGIACLAGPARVLGGAAASTSAQPPVNDWSVWLVIDAAGAITLFHKVTDLGQGTPSSFAAIVAHQLDVAPERIALKQAPVRAPYLGPDDDYVTSGSAGIRAHYASLRQLGATARAVLVQAAAARWQVAAAECAVQAGAVVHRPSARIARFADLADAAARLPVPSEVQVDERRMPRAAFAGRAHADEFGFLDGSAVFGVDVRLPNLSTAAIVHSPIAGGAVRSVDATAALRSAGVVDVVRLDDAVAVVASDFWTASQALRKLRIEWTPPPTLPDTDRHRQALLAAVAAGQGMPVRVEREGSAAEQRRASERVMDAAHRRVEAVFYVPWAAHVTMEPQTATAHVAEGRAELWLPTQSQAQVRSTVAALLKLPERAVTVNTTRVGGGFGRRLETDVAREATLIAQRVKRPVKLIWSREQDLHNDYFRPAAAARLRAGLDANGDVSSLVFDVAAPSILASSSNTHTLPADEPDFTAIMGLAGGYRLPEPSIGWTRVEAGLRSGWWRSVGCSANTFFLESFIDELAAVKGARPLAYRRALLAQDARALRVLQALEEQVGASAPVGQDWFWGFSWLRYSGSRVAHAVAVSREAERSIKLRRIVVAVDCGVVVNPHFARSQVVGGVVWGTAPALANAIFAATGRRLRELPFSSEAITFVD